MAGVIVYQLKNVLTRASCLVCTDTNVSLLYSYALVKSFLKRFLLLYSIGTHVHIYHAGDVDERLLGQCFRWGVSLPVPDLVITT
jgi:hypothetical protein